MAKAIQTRYDGYAFRSRLEARWAVFFNTLNLNWRYEPQGFKTTGGNCYLPDFRLEDVGLRSTKSNNLWIEVKGSVPDWQSKEMQKVKEFAEEEGVDVAILTGDVANDHRYGTPNYQYDRKGRWDNYMRFCLCDECKSVKYEFQETNYMTCERGHSNLDYNHPIMMQAVDNARSARFEHGESPTDTIPMSVIDEYGRL